MLAALAGNLAIATAKLAAYVFTGSSAILTEAIHSLVDTGDQGLLLLGMRRAGRPPDAGHPFGHGMEAYFWSFVVALMIFALGGAASVWQGLHKLAAPAPIERPWINLVVIGLAMLAEGSSFVVALRALNRIRADTPLLRSIRRSKDPNIFSVILEDGAALVGLVVALAGVSASAFLGLGWADGAASIAIGLLLVLVAAFLANETRSLLTGEAAAPRVVARIRAVLESDRRVAAIPEVLTVHLGPQEILVGLTLHLQDRLSRQELETALDELIGRIRATDPRITRVFMRPTAGGETDPPLARRPQAMAK